MPEKDFRLAVFSGIYEDWAGDFAGQGPFDTVEYLKYLGDILFWESKNGWEIKSTVPAGNGGFCAGDVGAFPEERL